MDAYKEFDAFQLRDDVVREYRDYVEGYIKIKDPQIRDVVNQSLDDGLLAPAPILQLNPAYQDGESIDELVADGVLHPDCKSIFVNPETGAPLRFYKHQTEAFRRAARSASVRFFPFGAGAPETKSAASASASTN